MSDYENCKGKSVTGVETSDCCARIRFSDGKLLSLDLYGDCCSDSYFNDQSQFAELLGRTIIGIEDRDGKSAEGLPDSGKQEYSTWSFLVFTTDKGHVTIDWRNDSNGCYYGEITAVLT